jgi:hypothetical protein
MTVAIRAEANTLLEEVKNITYERERLSANNRELVEKMKRYSAKNRQLVDENKKMAERLKAFESLNDLVQGSAALEASHEEQAEATSADESNASIPNPQNETLPLTDTGASHSLSNQMPPEVHASRETKAVEQNLEEAKPPGDVQLPMPNFADDSLVSRQSIFAYEEAIQELYLNAEYVYVEANL